MTIWVLTGQRLYFLFLKETRCEEFEQRQEKENKREGGKVKELNWNAIYLSGVEEETFELLEELTTERKCNVTKDHL